MTENLTKAKELYQDIATALSSQQTDIDRPDEQIGTIVDRAFEKLKQNEEKREALRIEHEENRRRTVGVFNKTVE